MTCQLSAIEKLLLRSASAQYQAIGHDICASSDEEMASALQDHMYDWLMEEEGVSTGLPYAWSCLSAERKFAICMAAL